MVSDPIEVTSVVKEDRKSGEAWLGGDPWASFSPDSEIKDFVRNEFGTVRLGDARLDRRLLKVAEGLARGPEWSIPHACGDWAGTKGGYRLCANEKVTRDKVMQGHIEATGRRVVAQEASRVLVIEDTTYLNFSDHPGTGGLGMIGSRKHAGRLRGVLLHSALAVGVERHDVVGVLDQQVIIREGYYDAQEKGSQKRNRDRESEKWMSSARCVVERLGGRKRVIFVFDREGDVFEAIEELQDMGEGFVIRASTSRRLEVESDERAYLFESVASERVIAQKTVHVPAGGGRKERTAVVCLRVGTYRLMPPKARDRRGESRQVNGMQVLEEDPPDDVKPLHWILLTSEPVATAQQALQILDHYCARWKIEEWHKGLKTGCRLEERQLRDWDRLEVLLGIFSVIAWRLLVLRDAARGHPTCPDEPVLTPTQRDILRKTDPSLRKTDDARVYLRAIAKLGGFLGRKRDGDPGWITLWRGYSRLFDMEHGYNLPREDPRCG